MPDSSTTLARLSLDEASARRVASYLAESLDPEEVACAAFEVEGARWRVEIYFRQAPDESAVRALVAIAAGEESARALEFETVTPQDWVSTSLAGLQPVQAGRFIVHGAHDRARVPPSRIGIEIEAALAFGTGHHGTTRGCLLALDMLSERWRKKTLSYPPPARGRSVSVTSRVGVIGRRNPRPAAFSGHPPLFKGRDKRILDIGTGSGVLAIAAAKTFRTHVLATDIDPRATASARENMRLNHTGAFVEVICAAGVSGLRVKRRAPYDLIFANILLGPLQRMAAPLSRLLGPNGHVVLSGLLPAHANAALAAYRAQGLTLERRIPLDGWMTLVLRR